jgi:hypothetical protein
VSAQCKMQVSKFRMDEKFLSAEKGDRKMWRKLEWIGRLMRCREFGIKMFGLKMVVSLAVLVFSFGGC